jgi:magnesium-protoporphyrin O-methyltransferase
MAPGAGDGPCGGSNGCGCDPLASMFDRRTAEHDRERYRRNGPDTTTKHLLELMRPYCGTGSTLLDIGGGIGVIGRALLKAGAGHATLVDASPAYLDVARQESRIADVLDRMEFVDGDFVRRAVTIERADLVTLDRVICCYADMERLVTLSAERAGVAYGIVLPRDRRTTRMAMAVMNVWFRLRRRAYRFYVHPTARVDAIVADAGLHPRAERRTWIWRVVVYDRSAPGF